MAANWSDNPGYAAPQFRMAGSSWQAPGRSKGSEMPGQSGTAQGGGAAGVGMFGAQKVAETQAEAAENVAQTGANAMVDSTRITADSSKDIARTTADSNRDIAGIYGNTQLGIAGINAQTQMAGLNAQNNAIVNQTALAKSQMAMQERNAQRSQWTSIAQAGLGALGSIFGGVFA